MCNAQSVAVTNEELVRIQQRAQRLHEIVDEDGGDPEWNAAVKDIIEEHLEAIKANITTVSPLSGQVFTGDAHQR